MIHTSEGHLLLNDMTGDLGRVRTYQCSKFVAIDLLDKLYTEYPPDTFRSWHKFIVNEPKGIEVVFEFFNLKENYYNGN